METESTELYSLLNETLVVNEQDHDDISSKCRELGIMFTDETFPPTLSSLCRDRSSENFDLFSRLKWDRLCCIPALMDKKLGLFPPLISSRDIKQGKLGDCYFLSALCVLAQNPARIRQLFVTRELSEVGVYAIYLTVNGQRTQVVIDDWIPTFAGAPTFAGFNDGSDLWVMLLEKAWAKLHRTYEAIEVGDPEHTMRDLTGAPSFSYAVDSTPDMHNILIVSLKVDYIVCSAVITKTVEESERAREVGLVANHAYAILEATNVVDNDLERVQMVKLRNPWGTCAWLGDWSRDSAKWTERLRKQLSYDSGQPDDGTFWMSMADFMRYFKQVEIAKLVDNFKYSFVSTRMPASHRSSSWLFTVDVPGMYTFSVSQKDGRSVQLGPDSYKFAPVRMILVRVEKLVQLPGAQDKVEYVQACTSTYRRDSYLELPFLPKGKYILMVELDWIEQSLAAERYYCVSCYGAESVTFTNGSDRYPIDETLRLTCQSIFEKGLGIKLSKQQPFEQDHPYIRKFLFKTQFGYDVTLIKNEGDLKRGASYIEKVKFDTFEGLQLCSPEKGSSYQVSVNPGITRIVMLR